MGGAEMCLHTLKKLNIFWNLCKLKINESLCMFNSENNLTLDKDYVLDFLFLPIGNGLGEG